ncbi:unnamed protein product [Caenorhabditis auriculariae]|uniref:BAT2 N-terminal domain-containing protein n=1 Tax=Caenorhabditis auriculariae TaxID=2777116 RepID=A0A8S1GZ08_9PELO|nr:unnamed protein product [Caenorhabditis auriculariae]
MMKPRTSEEEDEGSTETPNSGCASSKKVYNVQSFLDYFLLRSIPLGRMSSAQRGATGAVKPKSLNVNSIYSGRTPANGARAGGANKYGLQPVGKTSGVVRRMPPPATLPSLKAENNGQDPTTVVVPQGAVGWTKDGPQGIETAPPTPAAPVLSDLRPSWLVAAAETPSNVASSVREFPTLGPQANSGSKILNKWEVNDLTQKRNDGSSTGEDELFSDLPIPQRFFDNSRRNPSRFSGSSDARLSQSSDFGLPPHGFCDTMDPNLEEIYDNLVRSRTNTDRSQNNDVRPEKPKTWDYDEQKQPQKVRSQARNDSSSGDERGRLSESSKAHTVDYRILKRTEQLLLQDISDDEEVQMTRLDRPSVSIFQRKAGSEPMEGYNPIAPPFAPQAPIEAPKNFDVVKEVKPKKNNEAKKKAEMLAAAKKKEEEERIANIVLPQANLESSNDKEKSEETFTEEILPAPLPTENIWAKRQEERESQERDRLSRMPKAMQQAIEQHFPLVTEAATIKVDKESMRKPADADFTRAALRARKQATSNDVRRLMTRDEIGSHAERYNAQHRAFVKKDHHGGGGYTSDGTYENERGQRMRGEMRNRGPPQDVEFHRGGASSGFGNRDNRRRNDVNSTFTRNRRKGDKVESDVDLNPSDSSRKGDFDEGSHGPRQNPSQDVRKNNRRRGDTRRKNSFTRNDMTKPLNGTNNGAEIEKNEKRRATPTDLASAANQARIRSKNGQPASHTYPSHLEKENWPRNGEKEAKVEQQNVGLAGSDKNAGDEARRADSPADTADSLGDFEEVVNRRLRRSKEKEREKEKEKEREASKALQQTKTTRSQRRVRNNGKHVAEAEIKSKDGDRQKNHEEKKPLKAKQELGATTDGFQKRTVSKEEKIRIEKPPILQQEEVISKLPSPIGPPARKLVEPPPVEFEKFLELPEFIHSNSSHDESYDFTFDPDLHESVKEDKNISSCSAADDLHLKEKMSKIKDLWPGDIERTNVAMVKPQPQNGDTPVSEPKLDTQTTTSSSSSSRTVNNLAPYSAHYSSFQPLYPNSDNRSTGMSLRNAVSPPSSYNAFNGYMQPPQKNPFSFGATNFDFGLLGLRPGQSGLGGPPGPPGPPAPSNQLHTLWSQDAPPNFNSTPPSSLLPNSNSSHYGFFNNAPSSAQDMKLRSFLGGGGLMSQNAPPLFHDSRPSLPPSNLAVGSQRGSFGSSNNSSMSSTQPNYLSFLSQPPPSMRFNMSSSSSNSDSFFQSSFFLGSSNSGSQFLEEDLYVKKNQGSRNLNGSQTSANTSEVWSSTSQPFFSQMSQPPRTTYSNLNQNGNNRMRRPFNAGPGGRP